MMNKELKERINISYRIKSFDAACGEIEKWTDLGEFWANIKFKCDMTKVIGEISRTYRIFKIKMRHNSLVKKGMRLNWGKGQYYVSYFTEITKEYMCFEAVRDI